MLDIEKNICVTNLEDALEALESDSKAVLIAGGTDILIAIREGKLSNAHLISIGGVSELKGITRNSNGDICIGPLTTFRELEESLLIQRYLPILAQAAGTVGGPQIRAAGTIGGNICNGATSADTASTLCALNARLKIRALSTERVQSIHMHFCGPGKVNLAHNEILTSIIIPQLDYDGFTGGYKKYSMRKAMDIATLGCALWLKIDKKGEVISDVRVACGVAAPTPVRARNTEQGIIGLSLEQARILGPALLRQEINPRDSWRATRNFRIHIAGELLAQIFNNVINQGEEQC